MFCSFTRFHQFDEIFRQIDEKSLAIYYCTIISRDALKLPIPRDNNFSSQGAKPRGMNKLSPEGLAISVHPEKWSCNSISTLFAKLTEMCTKSINLIENRKDCCRNFDKNRHSFSRKTSVLSILSCNVANYPNFYIVE